MTDTSLIDRLIRSADQALRTVCGTPCTTGRVNPATDIEENELSDYERHEAGRLMRVNHVGEVCAQALYQGQALTARGKKIQESLEQAAAEENDHLAWCEQRLDELGARKSLLNPFWYAGSFALGAAAGLAGDKWNLGFLAETEHQVADHLQGHLQRLPEQDTKSRAIVEQMKTDETKHATTAVKAGGVDLPPPIKDLMRFGSKIMTRTAHWV